MVPNGTRAPGDKRPNFVFYFPDTIAAESCGGEYGNPVTETPFMDALAKEGTLFKQAHVLHTQCAPSRHAIVTGRYMHTTGHRTQSHGVEEWEPDVFKYRLRPASLPACLASCNYFVSDDLDCCGCCCPTDVWFVGAGTCMTLVTTSTGSGRMTRWARTPSNTSTTGADNDTRLWLFFSTRVADVLMFVPSPGVLTIQLNVA